VATSDDGKVVAAASAAGVTVLGPGGKRTKLALPGAAAVAVSADGSLVAGGGGDGVFARIWSADGALQHELRSFDASITDAAFSRDGLRVAMSSLDGTTRIWDVASGKAIRAFLGNKGVLSVAFSPDGNLVLTAGLDHLARLWDAETGEVRQVLQWHFGRVADANFSPDGRWIVTAGPVTIGLWTPGARDRLLPFGFGGHRGLLTSASFDPTGAYVLSSSADGTVRRASCAVCADLDTMLERADAQLAASGRKLTAEERERYGLD
jgi:WD40 repeat protein